MPNIPDDQENASLSDDNENSLLFLPLSSSLKLLSHGIALNEEKTEEKKIKQEDLEKIEFLNEKLEEYSSRVKCEEIAKTINDKVQTLLDSEAPLNKKKPVFVPPALQVSKTLFYRLSYAIRNGLRFLISRRDLSNALKFVRVYKIIHYQHQLLVKFPNKLERYQNTRWYIYYSTSQILDGKSVTGIAKGVLTCGLACEAKLVLTEKNGKVKETYSGSFEFAQHGRILHISLSNAHGNQQAELRFNIGTASELQEATEGILLILADEMINRNVVMVRTNHKGGSKSEFYAPSEFGKVSDSIVAYCSVPKRGENKIYPNTVLDIIPAPKALIAKSATQ